MTDSSWRRTVRLFAFVASIGAMLLLEGIACRAADEVGKPLGPEDVVPANLVWRDVEPGSRSKVLAMLAGQVAGNLERIRTWQGTCDVRLKEYLTPEFVSQLPVQRQAGKRPGALVKQSHFTLGFAIDFASKSVYRSKETSETVFWTYDRHERVEVNVSPVDEDSIVTAEHYVHMSPETKWPGFSMLPDLPELRNKRVAFRDAIKRAMGQEMGDLMDPRDFFGLAHYSLPFGKMLEFYDRCLRGKEGDKNQRLVVKGGRMRQADSAGEMWYEKSQRYEGDPPTFVRSIWSPAAGYHPVYFVYSHDREGKKPISRRIWQWRVVNGVRIPSRVRDTLYREDGGGFRVDRDVSLAKCTVNGRLDAQQFGYAGLGMRDGDVVVDRIEEVAYVLENGQLRKVATFRQPPAVRARRRAMARWAVVAFSAACLVAALVLLKRRRRRVEVAC